MDSVFIWEQNKDQTFTAEYESQNALLDPGQHSFAKVPGKSFTMPEDAKGKTLTLKPTVPYGVRFPWVGHSDDITALTSITLNNGALSIEFPRQYFGAAVFLGDKVAQLNLSLSNESKFNVSNFDLIYFAEGCATNLKNTSSINMVCHSNDSVIRLESQIKLEDSSKLFLGASLIDINNKISCLNNSTVDISIDNRIETNSAIFSVSDTSIIKILNKNEGTPVFDFENEEYTKGLFNFTRGTISNHEKPPTIIFGAKVFNAFTLSKIIAKGLITTTGYSHYSIQWKKLRENVYSIFIL